MLRKPAILVLEDGSVFHGTSIGADGQSVGEVVFNTAMTGYQEILTDPSYYKQIVTLTYPHIGNIGTNAEDSESRAVWVAGLVIRDLPALASNWRNEMSLDAYLKLNSIVAISDIDTRQLTRVLREKGALNGCLMAGDTVSESQALDAARSFPGLKGMDLAKEVTTDQSYEWRDTSWDIKTGYSQAKDDGAYHVVAYDYGVKHNMLRLLVDKGCKITVVPATMPAQQVIDMQPDGVLLTNGPGDPDPCDYAFEAINALLEKNIPVFGICLGHQLLALASGARTVKMKFGHHGANHPVQDLGSQAVMITSQNHGFAVDEATLPDNLKATHRSLFDGTLQGIHRTDKPAFAFQGHPEASPGPHDMGPLFEHFVNLMQEYRSSRG
jgi:carbamoyl-phosphate synthase small subunit